MDIDKFHEIFDGIAESAKEELKKTMDFDSSNIFLSSSYIMSALFSKKTAGHSPAEFPVALSEILFFYSYDISLSRVLSYGLDSVLARFHRCVAFARCDVLSVSGS